MPKTSATPSAPASPPFEAEFIEGLRDIYEEKIVFNRTLGIRLVSVDSQEAVARIAMRPELVGHFGYNRIHGGVISASLDAIGSLAVMAQLCAKHMGESVQARLQRFAKLGTIDLRIDYLRPGIGDTFDIRAQALRVGSRVGTSQMQFLGSDGTLLAAGMAAYIVS
jgi:uncharacterized protein (TIGR00369 family)